MTNKDLTSYTKQRSRPQKKKFEPNASIIKGGEKEREREGGKGGRVDSRRIHNEDKRVVGMKIFCCCSEAGHLLGETGSILWDLSFLIFEFIRHLLFKARTPPSAVAIARPSKYSKTGSSK